MAVGKIARSFRSLGRKWSNLASAESGLFTSAVRQSDVELPHRQLHRQRITELFQDNVRFAGQETVFQMPLLVVAFTNRSGSNLLADYLRQTGQVAGIGEYLNHDTVGRQTNNSSCESFPDYISHLVNRVRPGNRHFGVKASADQLGFLTDWRIPAMFPKMNVIHIHRDDLLDQAISHWIASQTGAWTSLQKPRSGEVKLSVRRIEAMMDEISWSDNSIRHQATLNSLNYMSVSYEELTHNPTVTLRRLLKFLDENPGDWHAEKPRISRQANQLNIEFREKMLEHWRRGRSQ